MQAKSVAKASAAVMAFAAALHLVRVLAGWDLVLGGYAVPAWVSLVVAVGVGYLAVRLVRQA